MDPAARLIATERYRKRQWLRRVMVFTTIALFAASVLFARTGDDWSEFDHLTFSVIRADTGNTLTISGPGGMPEHVVLAGITEPDDHAKDWLTAHAMVQPITLLLTSPQTRNASGLLQAFVFSGTTNLNVEMLRAGLAFKDRQQATILESMLTLAETEARKKKHGLWAVHAGTNNVYPTSKRTKR